MYKGPMGNRRPGLHCGKTRPTAPKCSHARGKRERAPQPCAPISVFYVQIFLLDCDKNTPQSSAIMTAHFNAFIDTSPSIGAEQPAETT
jgi:hypothetical protein